MLLLNPIYHGWGRRACLHPPPTPLAGKCYITPYSSLLRSLNLLSSFLGWGCLPFLSEVVFHFFKRLSLSFVAMFTLPWLGVQEFKILDTHINRHLECLINYIQCEFMNKDWFFSAATFWCTPLPVVMIYHILTWKNPKIILTNNFSNFNPTTQILKLSSIIWISCVHYMTVFPHSYWYSCM